MNKYVLLAFVCGLLQTFSAQSQCIDTLPANTIILTNDTTISSANGVVTYLICPGVEVNYAGNMSVLVNYYMEEGSLLNINNYHYPSLHMQSTAEVNANHSTAIPMASYLLSPVAEYGAIFTDTLDQYTNNITWCSNLVFEYSNLPGGVGCPAAPCVEVLPANTIIITSDTTIANATGVNNYLICPGVEVTYAGGMSTLNNYYMKEGSLLNVDNYHYPTVYMQSTAEINANHSTAIPMASYLLNPVAEYGAVFTDTLNQYTGNITWCSNLIFDYSNLSGGVGCPTMTALDKVLTASNLKVYPNPASGHIYVEFENFANPHFVTITNSLGQMVFEKAMTDKQLYIDISAWAGKGIYFLSVLDETGKTVGVRKVVIE